MASYICEKHISEDLNHTPLLNHDFDFAEFLHTNLIYFDAPSHWFNVQSNYFYSIKLTEDGLCYTYNPVKATSIFRKDTVDPAFIEQYESKKFGIDTKNWDMENGYTLKKMKNYPLRASDKGAQNGLKVRGRIYNIDLADVDTVCRKDTLDMKVAVHHPAEVVSNKNNFVNVPFNKSFTFLVRPSITRSSESLRSYDPTV
jgi:hypothetical protein